MGDPITDEKDLSRDRQIAPVRSSLERWNAWGEAHPENDLVLVDVQRAGANLTGADVNGANLRGASLEGAGL